MKINWPAFFRGVVKFVIHWYVLIILLAAVTAASAFPRTKQLYSNIDTDLTNLLPEDYESVKTIWKVRDMFQALAGMILVLEGPDIDGTQEILAKLADYLQRDPEISDVMYVKPGYDFFEKNALLYIDLEDLEEIDFRIDRRIQKEKLGGLYIDFEEEGDEEFKFGDIEEKYREKYSTGATSRYFASDNGCIYSIHIKPTSETEGISGQKKFYKHVREYVDAFMADLNDPEFKIYYTGSVRTRVEEYTALLRDLAKAGIISGIGIAIVLLLFFRRVFAVGIMVLPLSFGILATFAVASFFLDSLNLVTSFLFMILGGLGVEIGIHLVSRYIEERRSGKTMEDALFTVLYHTGGSALTSALTVAVTFLILMINDFKGFSEFGFIAGMGLIINYIAYMLVLPSLLVLAEKLRLLALKRSVGFVFAKSNTPSASGGFPRPRFALIGIAVLTIFAFVDIPQLQFQWKFKELKAEIPAQEFAKKKQRETSKSVNSPALVIIHNKEEADAIKAVVKKKMDENPDTTVINAYKSYFDLVPDDQGEKLEVVRRMQHRLEDDTIRLVKGEKKKDLDRFKDQLVKTNEIEEKQVPEEVRKLFWGNDMNESEQVAYINPLPHLEMDDGRNAILFSREIGVVETPAGTFHPSSDAIVFADVLRTMMRDGKRAIALAFLCVFIIVFLDFRSLKETVMIVSPIALGVLFMALFMYVFKIKFNFYNMVIAPTVVGTSIDNSVHLYHRYKELGRTNLMVAVRSTGGAAFLSSATNICGFLGLAFVNHKGLRSIGDLAILGMTACLLTTLIFFPALLQYLEDRRTKKAVIRPSAPPRPPSGTGAPPREQRSP